MEPSQQREATAVGALDGDPAAGAVVEVRGLSVAFESGARPLRGVDLTLQAGRVTGLVGESGSGKSMLGAATLGMLPGGARADGEARLAGTDMLRSGAEERRLVRLRQAGAVFQDPMTSLDPTMRVGRQVAEVAGSEDAAIEALDLCGIPDARRRAAQYPHELSGGLRQRALIALAVARRPRYVLLDEPTTALDVLVQRGILRLFRSICDELDAAMLFITHDLLVAAEVADRLVVLYGGQVAEEGPVDAVLRDPAHPYTAGLLATRLSARRDVARPVPALPGEPPDVRRRGGACSFAPRCAFAQEPCGEREPASVRRSPQRADACLRFDELQPLSERAAVAHRRAAVAELDELAPVDAPQAAGPTAAALEVTGLRKAFGRGAAKRTVLDGIDLRLDHGSSMAIVGASGCGKTTLLRCVMGLERADAGEVRHAGVPPQLVPQDSGASLTPWMTIGDLLGERLGVGKVPRAERPAAIERALAQVGLPAEVAGRRPRQLSGGQRQRVAIARAIVLPPSVLVCDEPTSALDVSLTATVVNLLHQLRDDLGLAVLFVTHDLGVARSVADEIAVLQDGRVVERGAAPQVLDAPAHAATRELLDAMPEELR
ncbi:oligopeptide/dipeptide ABC transporter ATP-binding protein [Conexibacter woesei]|uniref:Oligopeptide/dipeptide ABC transporter, ATPase subunit n=1 Tax=Conexibacter woesei (strain DSM 14684 / CCUG 47730 / CIP 108061 / JCM 11494 / NBRC 100937 / ID131577) TaxID=469383 RepID=D3F7B9_CONWI|nr:ABC transporter ATP-binding protein [Conexibacter woesei]ADB48890.1 oligopeptide/dipeptide ABC transporter, ATPase subunit [Conexibacter woesei DSM 14684]